MELFKRDSTENLLPCDGDVYYFGKILDIEKSDFYFNYLLENIEWKNDEAIIFGKKIITNRKVAWYGEKPFEYTYSKVTKLALPFSKILIDLKKIAEDFSQEKYNSCLLNLYHNGNEGMAWHSDGEKDLKKNGAIASMSFGAERKFSFKHKTNAQKIDLNLEHGSLLIMTGTTQQNWLHRLPPTKRINSARINLTFRTIVE